jgi:ribokinase
MESSASRSFDLITIGDLCVDLAFSGGDVVPAFGQVEKLVGDYVVEMGGSCAIFACQAAKLGLRVAILGRVGPDMFGDLVVHRLRECGVDTRFITVDPSLKTGLSVALSQGDDRAILTYPGSLAAVEPGDVSDELLRSARHLHHGSYYLHTRLLSHMPAILRRARAFGLSVSLDTNWDPEEQWQRGLDDVLPLVDVFLPNDQEALRIAGAAALPDALVALHRRGAPLVVVKQGADGALASDGDNIVRETVQPVTGGDSIGAGDSFDAGFLSRWLRGAPLGECLRLGCACGRAVAGAVGGLSGQPRLEELATAR